MGFNLKKILKSLLFSTSDALSIKDIQAVITRYHQEQDALADKKRRGSQDLPTEAGPSDDSEEQSVIEDIIMQVPTILTATQIREAMEEIAGELEESGEVFRLLQSSSGFKFAISKEYAEWVRLLRNDPRPQRLSRSALETLAIVAYRQPVTRAEIEAIRGVSADGPISRLIEKELVYISGRADLPGRPLQYSTTQNFLDFIGVNSIEELPASDVLNPGQISEWIRRASNPSEIKDSDVGLPDDGSEESLSDAPISSGEALDNSGSQTGAELHEKLREGELPLNADRFPYDASESAGGMGEFEAAEGDSKGRNI